ncbi:60S ribosome subunit biogenesis protein nip7 [Rozella allomycis CSF55]|uniref:60S ribosome subunit biogenesis protein NIP7 n=1 Tax=Rozella allomycis (strain CSF55) TaxID=988480 RepID=A0A075AU06_ROZAC|nr:60S ribosome subunit biogenesis protein nip7 [Rozella allomycis CSF55]|eukprot:EPZ33610.1 60S ribosome subunit biogenesis protein nip7 [Rozella allomycis CSF55]
MRELTESETRVLFEKLSKYIGRNITDLIDRPDEPFCFRLQKDRVYYVSEKLAKLASNVSRDNLLSLGVCMGKFTKSGKFNLHITALDILAQYALWLKPSGEMSYLYGNHVLKAHIQKMSEDCPQHQGVIICSANDQPMGFAVSARAAVECKTLEPTAIVGYHQADLGEYLRGEETLA